MSGTSDTSATSLATDDSTGRQMPNLPTCDVVGEKAAGSAPQRRNPVKWQVRTLGARSRARIYERPRAAWETVPSEHLACRWNLVAACFLHNGQLRVPGQQHFVHYDPPRRRVALFPDSPGAGKRPLSLGSGDAIDAAQLVQGRVSVPVSLRPAHVGYQVAWFAVYLKPDEGGHGSFIVVSPDLMTQQTTARAANFAAPSRRLDCVPADALPITAVQQISSASTPKRPGDKLRLKSQISLGGHAVNCSLPYCGRAYSRESLFGDVTTRSAHDSQDNRVI
jgi:hypothetical protein